MVTALKRRDATLADLESLPDNVVGEIIDGELVVSPRPASRHARAASELGADLLFMFGRGRGGPGGWVLLDEPELHLGPRPDVLVPDIAGWRRERMPEMPDVVGFTLAPDWVAEVLSPSTERIDRVQKMALYAREHVRHAWLLNPSTRTLEVFRLESGSWLRVFAAADDAKVRAEPFDAVEIDLALLWAR